MTRPPTNVLFGSDLWEPALEKYAEATHVTVKLFDTDLRVVFGPIHPTPLFELFDRGGYDPGLFAECARQCLVQAAKRPTVTVSKAYGLAAIGTSLVLDGRVVGAAVAGYVLVDFSQLSEIQRVAKDARLDFARVWQVAREQSPVSQQRVNVNGELLQVLGDALLRENARTRQYEHAAMELQELARIVTSSDDAIISKDLNGVILSWNGGAERLFGYTAEEAIGQRIAMLIPPERFDEEPSILQKVCRGEPIEHYETVRRRKDGKLLDISLTVSPIRDNKGRIVGASKIARDITQLKEVEKKLRESHGTLETRVKERTLELEIRNSEILAQSDQLQDLSLRLMRAQDEERRRISRELHDSLGQYLASAKMSIEALKRPDATAKESQNIERLAETLEKCVTETRTISYLLHPPLLDEVGFSSAAKWYIQGFSERSGIHANANIANGPERLPVALELALFRILQESLVNVHRHAQSQSVDIQLEFGAHRAILQIRDHGQGMPPELLKRFKSKDQLGGGVGLRSMSGRIRELGGLFEIESDKNGTLIRVTAPVNRA